MFSIFRAHKDLFSVLLMGLVTLAASYLEVVWLRIGVGFFYVYFFSGYSLYALISYKETWETSKAIIGSLSLSLLLLYPAGVLTTVIEGQSVTAIFGSHVVTSVTSLLLINSIIIFVTIWLRNKSLQVFKPEKVFLKSSLLVLVPIIIFSFLCLYRLDRASVYRDEYDIIYQAYNLIDGFLVGRMAYTISFNTHPPLIKDVNHYSLQLLHPEGLDSLEDWQFRFADYILGLMVIIGTYILVNDFVDKQTALIASSLLSVNQYLLFLSRSIERSIVIAPLAVAGCYFLLKFLQSKSKTDLQLLGLVSGASLLVKITALTNIAAYLITLLVYAKRKIASVFTIISFLFFIYLPVLVYNLGGYLVYGKVDSVFAKIFRIDNPNATIFVSVPIWEKVLGLLLMLVDQFSLPVSILFFVSIISLLWHKSKNHLIKLQLTWLSIICIFFILTGYRSYYMVFIAVPLTILAATFLQQLLKRNFLLSRLLLCIVLIYSAYYGYTTHIDDTYAISESFNDAGTTGTPLLLPSLNRHYSVSARDWVEDRGWKQLQENMDRIITQKDCLIVDQKMDSLAVRRYFSTNDKLKEQYLGKNYQRRFPDCNLSEGAEKHYLLTNNLQEHQLVFTLQTKPENPQFFLYQTSP